MSKSGTEQLVLIGHPEFEKQRPDHGQKDPLEKVRQTARLLAEVQTQFAKAVTAARRSGCTWRRIGTVSGVPYQTLHRQMTHQRPPGARRSKQGAQ